MHGSTYLLNRNGRYYFRRPIPANLRPAFDGRVEFKHSLGTTSKTEARAKAEHLTLQTSVQLAAARRRLFPEHQRTTLTKEEARHLAKMFASKLLGADEDARIAGDRDELDELADHYGNLDGDLAGHRQGSGEAGCVRREATSFALEQRVCVPPKAPAMRTLLYYIRAELKAAPLMSLYSGARLEELGQLRVDDFQKDPDRGWHYAIHERGEGMHAKSVAAVRVVPMHPELKRLGLIRYVEAAGAGGGAAVPKAHGTEEWAADAGAIDRIRSHDGRCGAYRSAAGLSFVPAHVHYAGP
jgi:integrase